VAYSAYEKALDNLPRPTVIVCKSARRAGAIWATYMGVKGGKSAEEVAFLMDYRKSINKGLSYTSALGLVAWSNVVLDLKKKNKVWTSTPLIFRQMFDNYSSTYSYLLGDVLSGEAVLIDPVHDCVERDLSVIKGLGLTLKYAINTHVHDDHVSGSLHIKHVVHKCQSMISTSSGGKADILLNDMDLIHFGARSLICLHTPGHTPGCCSFVLDDLSRCFTGDLLLIHGCGLIHKQEGSAQGLYESVHDRLYPLPDQCSVWPAHNFTGLTSTSILEEKKCNPLLSKSLVDFVHYMDGLRLISNTDYEVNKYISSNLNEMSLI